MFANSKAVRTDELKMPRISTSRPIRTGDVDRPVLGQKKAVSLDQISLGLERDEAFGSVAVKVGHGRKVSRGTNNLSSSARAHKRINSGENHLLASSMSGAAASISRSTGHKSGLALSLSPGVPAPDFASNSSISSLSSANLTPPGSAFSPAGPPIFEDVKPLQEVFEQENATVTRKFKPRDSGVVLDDGFAKEGFVLGEDVKMGGLRPLYVRQIQAPMSTLKPMNARTKRPAMLKRTSSMGDERQACETPIMPVQPSWTIEPRPFEFLGESGIGLGLSKGEDKPSMPGTPVKRNAFTHSSSQQNHARLGVGHSISQPTLASGSFGHSAPAVLGERKTNKTIAPTATQRPMMMVPPSTKKAVASVPHLTLTTTSSPDSTNALDTDMSSPTIRVAEGKENVTVLLGRTDGEASDSDGTPTKGGGERHVLSGEFNEG
jgi:mitosis inhibitor protein kinase SWE1